MLAKSSLLARNGKPSPCYDYRRISPQNRVVPERRSHIHLEPPPIYSTGEARASGAPWTTFKGETKVSYTETTYYTVPSLVDDLTTSIQTAYGDLPLGVLCRNFAAQRCYEETI